MHASSCHTNRTPRHLQAGMSSSAGPPQPPAQAVCINSAAVLLLLLCCLGLQPYAVPAVSKTLPHSQSVCLLLSPCVYCF
jgi:hypothetical protein